MTSQLEPFTALDVIYNEDCIEGMKRIPDNSVDLVVMDPPYQLETNGGGTFGNANRTYLAEISNLSKGITNATLNTIVTKMKAINIYIWCNKAQFRQYLDFFDDLGCKADLLTWHKTNPTPTCNNKYLSDTEYLFYFRESGVKLYGNYETKRKHYETPTNTIDKERYGHPTVKPLDIIRNIIQNSTVGGGSVVFDPFMGSGTTAVACIETGRHYIGFEICPEYYNAARKRIESTLSKIIGRTTLENYAEASQ